MELRKLGPIPRLDEQGQAITEYILMVSVVIAVFTVISQGIARTRLVDKLMKPITQDFAAAYKYGHPKAKGYDEGSPEYHPRATEGGTNFRMFFNPRKK